MRAAATNKVSPTERTGFVGFSRFFGGNAEKLRPVLPVTGPADWITGGRRGGATLSIILSEVVIGSPGVPYLELWRDSS